MNIKQRLSKLEAQLKASGQPMPDLLTPRAVNYRAGLIPGIEDPPETVIKLRLRECPDGQRPAEAPAA